MASEGLNLAAITFTLYRNVRFVIRNGYNEDALKVFPFLGMVVMASVFVSQKKTTHNFSSKNTSLQWTVHLDRVILSQIFKLTHFKNFQLLIALSSCYTSFSRMELQTLFLIFLFCHIPFFVIFAVNETNYIKVFDIKIRHGVIKILVRIKLFFAFIKAASATVAKKRRY